MLKKLLSCPKNVVFSKTKITHFLSFLDKMQFSAIFCLETYDGFVQIVHICCEHEKKNNLTLTFKIKIKSYSLNEQITISHKNNVVFHVYAPIIVYK